ncbi:MAG: ATP synthase F1 subunit delta [Planctomycetaceae bacterium]|jgi:F-type H+-transporting ATPase subunit delta|nr:ATP synthase F1 subunit delta [Planctomycetaceae bacterium]
MENTAYDAQFAAEFNADVGVEKIAEVYAEAYLNAVAAQHGSAEDAVQELASLIDVLKTQPKFEAVLASAMIPTEEKIALLEKTIAPTATPSFWNFLKIVAKRNRLNILTPIFVQTQKLLDKRSKRIPVVITTATEIDSQLLLSLSEKLRGIIGGEPIVRCVVDSETIGGIVVRVGDTIYDASILTQLKNVRQQMIERSAHEIQRQRDHFRTTEESFPS